MNRRRVKITGIGPVTPAGIGREAFWKGILEPVSRVTKIKRFPEEAGTFLAAEVKDFRLENYAPGVSSKRMPQHTQFAVAGAHLALADAGLEMSELRGRSPLVMVGASLMDFGAINKGVDLIVRKGINNALPTSVFSSIARESDCIFAMLRAGDDDTVSFNRIYNPVLALDGTDVAIFYQGHPKLVKYDSLNKQWCLSEHPFKQFCFLGVWTLR